MGLKVSKDKYINRWIDLDLICVRRASKTMYKDRIDDR